MHAVQAYLTERTNNRVTAKSKAGWAGTKGRTEDSRTNLKRNLQLSEGMSVTGRQTWRTQVRSERIKNHNIQ